MGLCVSSSRALAVAVDAVAVALGLPATHAPPCVYMRLAALRGSPGAVLPIADNLTPSGVRSSGSGGRGRGSKTSVRSQDPCRGGGDARTECTRCPTGEAEQSTLAPCRGNRRGQLPRPALPPGQETENGRRRAPPRAADHVGSPAGSPARRVTGWVTG